MESVRLYERSHFNMSFEEWKEKFIVEDKGISRDIRGKTNSKYTYNIPTGKTPSIKLPQNMSPAQREAYLIAVRNEPKITADLQRITSEVGGELAGLDFRLKTPESYMRKIAADIAQDALEEKSAINKVFDIIRYTNISTPENLAEVFRETVEKLKSEGYTLSRVKNTWGDPNNPYKGVNTIFHSPTGQAFELQFHTQESFDLKQGQLHELYEEARLPSTSEERREELNNLMRELSSSLRIPDSIETVK